jgi:hypothetical protein
MDFFYITRALASAKSFSKPFDMRTQHAGMKKINKNTITITSTKSGDAIAKVKQAEAIASKWAKKLGRLRRVTMTF